MAIEFQIIILRRKRLQYTLLELILTPMKASFDLLREREREREREKESFYLQVIEMKAMVLLFVYLHEFCV